MWLISLWFPWNVVSIKCSNFRLSQWSEKHVVDWIAVNGVHHWISISVGCSSKNIWRSLGRQSHFAVAFRLRENESYSKDFIAGWWFQTFGLLSISKMGCHPSHWLIFFKMAIAPPTSLVYPWGMPLPHASQELLMHRKVLEQCLEAPLPWRWQMDQDEPLAISLVLNP